MRRREVRKTGNPVKQSSNTPKNVEPRSRSEILADHISAVDPAIEQGFADEDKLFIAGDSAGGAESS